MKRIIVTICTVCLVAGCSQSPYSADRPPTNAAARPTLTVPEHIPKQAEPVWRVHAAYTTDDFELFYSLLSVETRSVIETRVGLREAFEDGKKKQMGPLGDITFSATDHDPDTGLKLKPGFAMVEYRHGRHTKGSLVKLEDGQWKLAYPRKMPMRDVFEQDE